MRRTLVRALTATAVALALLPALPAAAAEAPPRPDVVVRGSGWGHSVGLSQYGARAMAIAGHSYGQILRHYYTGVDVGGAGALPGATEIRVNLFERRGVQTEPALLLATASRHGGAPSNRVRVAVTPGAEPVTLPPGETWALTQEPAGYVLRDAAAAVRAVGPGPVAVAYSPAGGEANPALLRLPQLGAEGLRGTFQWGYLQVTRSGGDWNPVMVLPLELYLRGLAEVPSGWQMEALKAQAVAGRTYATRQIRSNPGAAWHLGATPAWQVYAGWEKEGSAGGDRWVTAVDATREQVVSHQGELAWTFYSSSHGGRSEHSEDSWAYSATLPYLRSVDDPWSLDPAAGNPYASWEETVEHGKLAGVLGDDWATITRVQVLSRTAGGSPRVVEVSGWATDGRRVTREFSGAKGAGAALRNPLGLRSQQIHGFAFPPFRDDDGNIHEYNIWAVWDAGIARGCGDERFCPDQPVTRAQMATFLAAALGLRLDPAAEDAFDDIGASVHRDAINAVASAGVTAGCAEGRYCPSDPVTRAQMAAFLQRAFDLAPADSDHFTDTAGNVHRDAINAVAEAEITAGCAADRYCPLGVVTRAQMATFIARAQGFGW